jgi:hypothetical protein
MNVHLRVGQKLKYPLKKNFHDRCCTGAVWFLLILLVAGCFDRACGRDRISIDSNWKFRLGDPSAVTTTVTWYPEIAH